MRIDHGSSYRLPDWARGHLGRDAGVPWGDSQRVPELNRLTGLVWNSFQWFERQRVVIFATTKFDIDGDGSDGRIGRDTYLPDTSLHDEHDRALSSSRIPFAVLPLSRSGAKNDPGDFGLGLGDLGIVFRFALDGVMSKEFVFGDCGPRGKIGEGSIALARALRINANPNTGGLHGLEWTGERCLMWVCFAGSGIQGSRGASGHERLFRTLDQIKADAWECFREFTGAAGGAAGMN